MPLGVMCVIEREVLRPVRARLRELQDGLEKRRIIRPRFHWRNLHLRALRQLCLGREDHNAIFDCAFEAHRDCLARPPRQRKPALPKTFWPGAIPSFPEWRE